MDAYRLLVWLHVVLAVLAIGIALYWTIMRLSLARVASPARMRELLDVCASARWPHVAVPWRLRLPLPLFGLAVTAALVVTGLLAGGRVEADVWFYAKTAVALPLLVILQLWLLRRRDDAATFGQLPLTLLLLLFSAAWVR